MGVDTAIWLWPQEHVDWSDCLTFSFEVEGRSLAILDYYKKPGVDTDEWMKMTTSARFASVGQMWYGTVRVGQAGSHVMCRVGSAASVRRPLCAPVGIRLQGPTQLVRMDKACAKGERPFDWFNPVLYGEVGVLQSPTLSLSV